MASIVNHTFHKTKQLPQIFAHSYYNRKTTPRDSARKENEMNKELADLRNEMNHKLINVINSFIEEAEGTKNPAILRDITELVKLFNHS